MFGTVADGEIDFERDYAQWFNPDDVGPSQIGPGPGSTPMINNPMMHGTLGACMYVCFYFFFKKLFLTSFPP